MPAEVVDLELWKAERMAELGPRRMAGAELSADGSRVLLTLPSGHVEEIRGVVAIRLSEVLKPLGEWAKDVEAGEADEDGGLFT